MENDVDAKAVLAENFPEAHHWDDVRTLMADEIRRMSRSNPHVAKVIVVGGFPCQDLSGLNHGRKGLESNRSSLLLEMVRIETEVIPSVWPTAVVESLWENVDSMNKVDKEKISHL